MQSLDELFNEVEAESLAKARIEMAEEKQRYETDPAYRAEVDAKHAKFVAELEAQENSMQSDDDAEDYDDEDDESEDD